MRQITTSVALLVAALFIGCSTSTAPKNEEQRTELTTDSQAALTDMKTADPSLDDFLKKSYGYVIFPSVGKGGFIAGGAYGRGQVFEKGQPVGWSEMSQATIGAQAGGQTFSELIVFEDDATMARFKEGKIAFAANASAVALKSGAASSARYTEGVATFVKPQGGLMFEASVGGQKFRYQPEAK
jgi:lipid-binding SYLF domain-containing protein